MWGMVVRKKYEDKTEKKMNNKKSRVEFSEYAVALLCV